MSGKQQLIDAIDDAQNALAELPEIEANEGTEASISVHLTDAAAQAIQLERIKRAKTH